MTPDTQKEYFSKANHHLKLWQNSYQELTLAQYMEMIANEYSFGSWRGIRRALVVLLESTLVGDTVIEVYEIDIESALNQIVDLKNPLTRDIRGKASSKKRAKHRGDRKYVTTQEHDKILQALDTNNPKDRELASVLEVARLIGMRAIEVFNAEMMADYGELFINGAKKNTKGNRGLDRLFELDPDSCSQLNKHYECVDKLIEAELGKEKYLVGLTPEEAEKLAKKRLKVRIGQRLYRLTRKLWPRRKNQITLKTYRHQKSSDMKAAHCSPIEIAASLGHQSVRSQHAYGHPRRGQRTPLMQVAAEFKDMVRITHPRTMFKNRSPETNSKLSM